MFPLSIFRYRKDKQVIQNFILKPLVEAYNVMKGRDPNAVNYDENTITKKIVWYLKNDTSIAKLYQRRTIVIVMRPKEQLTIGEIYEPDIKFFSPKKRVVMEIEAKRFYKGNKWSTFDYLNDNEGIGRFLLGKYSKNEEYGGMIGYVQNGNLQKIILNVKLGLLKKHCRNCQVFTRARSHLASFNTRRTSIAIVDVEKDNSGDFISWYGFIIHHSMHSCSQLSVYTWETAI
jgi:hypothetical protein